MQSGAILRAERGELTCKRCNDGREGGRPLPIGSLEIPAMSRETEIVSSIWNEVTRITMQIIARPASSRRNVKTAAWYCWERWCPLSSIDTHNCHQPSSRRAGKNELQILSWHDDYVPSQDSECLYPRHIVLLSRRFVQQKFISCRVNRSHKMDRKNNKTQPLIYKHKI